MPVFDPDQPKETSMQFAAKTESQIREESLIPEGEYDFTVVQAANKTSKAGNDMIQLDLDIFVGGAERPMKDWLMEKMAFKLLHFCSATGLIAKYESGSLDAQDCVGKSGKLTVVIKDGQGAYGKQNSIKDYVVPVAAPKDNEPLPPKAPVYDDPSAPPF
jgi:hypothetical protein